MSIKFFTMLTDISREEENWIRNIPKPEGWPAGDIPSQEQYRWKNKYLDKLRKYGIEDEFITNLKDFPKCKLEIEKSVLKISSGKDGDLRHVACIVQGLFRKFRPGAVFYFTWSQTHADEFGGGYVVISSKSIHCESSRESAEYALKGLEGLEEE